MVPATWHPTRWQAGGLRGNLHLRLAGEVALARYNTDGTLDETFGENGKVTTDITSGFDFANTLVLQPDDRIVAGGIAQPTPSNQKYALARYNSDGTLDDTFSGNGKLTMDFALPATMTSKASRSKGTERPWPPGGPRIRRCGWFQTTRTWLRRLTTQVGSILVQLSRHLKKFTWHMATAS
jgi:uncharacterized delta-60 repeat protein